VKLALVTAGTRRVGAAIADRLVQAGWTVARHSRTASTDSSVHADLADPVAVAGLLPAVVAQYGVMPSLLVNNASLFSDDVWQTVDLASLERHQRINATAPLLLARDVAKAASAARPACIINILDQRVAQPPADQFAYTASKLALAEYTRLMASSFAPLARVNAVAPGLTLPTADYSEAQLARLAGLMPLGRLPVPDEIADAVAWLAGAASVTGQTIFVDGGAHLKSFERDFVNL
jgi:pteridine reductase